MGIAKFKGKEITVIGAGAWGTTLADMIAGHGYSVRLWCFEAGVASQIREHGVNEMYLNEVKLGHEIIPLDDLEEALAGAQLVIFAIPSQHYRDITSQARAYLEDESYILSVSKGFEVESFRRMTEILDEELAGLNFTSGVLSGPNLSREIALRKPAVSLVASKDETFVKTWQELLSSQYFRIYAGTDVVGTELGGALKNIYAIAAGIASGLYFGNNTLASLISRSLKEMVRLGVTLGADAETFFGASGIGDLVCTSYSTLSRNQQVGKRLAAGEALEDIQNCSNHIAEGIFTTKAVKKYIDANGIEMPIATEVYRVLFEGLDAREGVQNLMGRTLGAE